MVGSSNNSKSGLLSNIFKKAILVFSPPEHSLINLFSWFLKPKLIRAVEKNRRYVSSLKDYEYQQKEIKRLQSIADRFRYKPSKASMAMSKLKMIERMTIINLFSWFLKPKLVRAVLYSFLYS